MTAAAAIIQDLTELRRRLAPHLAKARKAYGVWPRLDLLVYTPEEFERMRAEGRPFIEQVLAEGIVVHEAEADRWEAARRLDQYYVPTRSPNGLPGGVPAEVARELVWVYEA